jgi:hypothetical protein
MIFISPYPLSFLLMRIVLVSLEGHPIAAHNRNAKHTGLNTGMPQGDDKIHSPESLEERDRCNVPETRPRAKPSKER